jgi:hypothetical protein
MFFVATCTTFSKSPSLDVSKSKSDIQKCPVQRQSTARLARQPRHHNSHNRRMRASLHRGRACCQLASGDTTPSVKSLRSSYMGLYHSCHPTWGLIPRSLVQKARHARPPRACLACLGRDDLKNTLCGIKAIHAIASHHKHALSLHLVPTGEGRTTRRCRRVTYTESYITMYITYTENTKGKARPPRLQHRSMAAVARRDGRFRQLQGYLAHNKPHPPRTLL